MKKAGMALFPSASSLKESQTAFELCWWHLSLLVPTLGFKYLYVRRMSFTTGLQTILDSLGNGIDRYFNLLLLATIDILEVSIIVGVLFVVGRLLLRVPSKALIFASVFVSLIIMGANQYSLLVVASLLTVDTLSISTHWVKEHPYLLLQSVTPQQIGFIALAVLWSSFCGLLPSPANQCRRLFLPLRGRAHSFFFTALLIGSALGCLASLRMSPDFPLVLRGYWSSTFISFFKLDTPELAASEVPALTTIQADYQRLAYPRGTDPQPRWFTALPADKLIPRHILIAVLETAPRQYYRLTDNPALPVFYRMSKHAVISNHHYAMSPYSWWNNASIVSGNYFLQKGKGIFDYGDFESDSIASILGRRGYTTAFIDSFKLGWARTTGFWKNLGFTHLADSEDDPIPFDRTCYSVTLDKERQSFARALGTILDAESRRKKALVMLATTIGHHPWLAKPGAEGYTNEQKIHGLAALFDRLFGEFLQSLTKHGLDNQVLIVVTGDHGFRMRREFESVGLEAEHGDAAFNVPFLLYGPGLFQEQIRLPYVTSHVDIAPTLLALTGVQEASWLHHGTNMLDQRLRDRVTFMMNTNLSPVSGFHWNGCHYTLNDLTGRTHVRGSAPNADSESIEASQCDPASRVLSDQAVRSMLEAANRQFQITLAHFRQRKAVTVQVP